MITETENTSPNQHISDVIREMLGNPTRRSFLTGRPKSATICITKVDGGVIGL